MINSRNFLKLLASVPLFGFGSLLSSCGINNNDRIFRYIITVNVETGDREYSGSSVWQTKYHEQAINIIDTNRSETKGEAVVVDINGKYLFLLVNLSMSGITGKASDDAVNEFEKNQSWEITDFKDYPFVTFTDIGDPLTVKKITQDNFGQYFMGGKITSIEVQKTNEPVTYGQVEQIIPWIRDGITRDDNMHAKRPLFDEDEINYPNGPPYNSLSVVQFIKI